VTLVAVNGLGGLEHLWDGFRAALGPEVELRVLDLAGHGERPPAPDYGYDALVAARHPDQVTRLVLLDPAAPHQSRFLEGPTPGPVHPYTFETVEEAAQQLAAIDPTTTEEDVRRSYRWNREGRLEPRFDPAIFPALVEDARRRGDDLRAELERIVAPTLCIRGERSFLDPGQLAELAAAIPDSRVASVPGAGHFMLREQPERVARLVREFLEEPVA
jgi:pimeloyl-ACP methyl ester carboxylesterase